MTDKYEEFKKWFKHHPIDDDELDLVFAIGNLFREFEKHCEEKEKEKQVKKLIREVFNEVPLNELEKEKHGIIYEIFVPVDITDEIYKRLKAKDLLK